MRRRELPHGPAAVALLRGAVADDELNLAVVELEADVLLQLGDETPVLHQLDVLAVLQFDLQRRDKARDRCAAAPAAARHQLGGMEDGEEEE